MIKKYLEIVNEIRALEREKDSIIANEEFRAIFKQAILKLMSWEDCRVLNLSKDLIANELRMSVNYPGDPSARYVFHFSHENGCNVKAHLCFREKFI